MAPKPKAVGWVKPKTCPICKKQYRSQASTCSRQCGQKALWKRKKPGKWGIDAKADKAALEMQQKRAFLEGANALGGGLKLVVVSSAGKPFSQLERAALLRYVPEDAKPAYRGRKQAIRNAIDEEVGSTMTGQHDPYGQCPSHMLPKAA